MKFIKFIKPLVCILIVCSFIRATASLPNIQVQELLYRVSTFEFSIESLIQVLDAFENVNTTIVNLGWNSNLGLLDNIGLFIEQIFNMLATFFGNILGATWQAVLDVVVTLKSVFNVVFYAIGVTP